MMSLSHGKISPMTLLLGLTLSACASDATAPVAQKTLYQLPMTPGARLCANQCQQARGYCVDGCSLDYRACFNQALADAQRDYDAYVRQQFSNHAPAILVASDFQHPAACEEQKKSCLTDCGHPYDACYKDCGGTISVTSSCQFMCFE